MTVDPWLAGALAATLLAFALRVTGIGFGLPYHFHWDEPTVMNRAIRMGGGDLNPHFFYYPTLLMYVLLVAQGTLYAVGHAMHAYPSPDAFAAAYLTDSTVPYLVGRCLVASLGTATVFLCYAVGRRFLSAPAGLIAALLLAVSPVHIGSSHFVTNDVPMTFFALLAYLFLWNVYARGRGRDYVGAGVMIGLGTATKYLPVVLLVSLALAHACRLRNETGSWLSARRGFGLVIAGGLAAAISFSIASPYVLLDWRSALRDYQIQASLSGAAGCSKCGLNFVPYLTHTIGWSVGWPAYVLALIGLGSLAWTRGERRFRGILLASFPIVLFLLVGFQRQDWARWLVPIAPFACLAAGAVLWTALRRVAAPDTGPRAFEARRWALGVIGLAAVALTAAPPAASSVRFDRLLLTQDPRSQAVAWFENSVPGGNTVAVQPMLDRYFLTAQLRTDSDLQTLQSWVPPNKLAARQMVEEKYDQHPIYHEVQFSYDIRTLKARGVRYIVLSSAHYHNVDPTSEDQLYFQLAHQARLVARFSPRVQLSDAGDYPVSMPTITVYELP